MKPIKQLKKNKKDIKIAFLTTISQTMEWFNVERIKFLKKNGFENITLICNMNKQFIEKYKDLANLISLKIERGAKPFNIFKTEKILKRLFKKEKFDVLYYLTPNVSFCASLAGRHAKIPVRIYSQCGIRYVSESGIKRILLKYIEKFTCKNSTIIRSQSQLNMKFAIDEKLVSFNKIAVIGIGGTTGVDLETCDTINSNVIRKSLRQKHNIPNNACVYGYVGRLNKDKGCNELLEAFREITNIDKNAFLIHLGMVDDENPVTKENYEFYKNSTKIIKTGNVTQKEVYEYMTAMDILVHPTYREGLGKVLQEAMGMKLPIITTDTIGPKEVVEDGISGILVPPRNKRALKEQMVELSNNKELRKKLAENGRARAEKYFDKKIMLTNFYEDFIKCVGVDDD